MLQPGQDDSSISTSLRLIEIWVMRVPTELTTPRWAAQLSVVGSQECRMNWSKGALLTIDEMGLKTTPRSQVI